VDSPGARFLFKPERFPRFSGTLSSMVHRLGRGTWLTGVNTTHAVPAYPAVQQPQVSSSLLRGAAIAWGTVGVVVTASSTPHGHRPQAAAGHGRPRQAAAGRRGPGRPRQAPAGPGRPRQALAGRPWPAGPGRPRQAATGLGSSRHFCLGNDHFCLGNDHFCLGNEARSLKLSSHRFSLRPAAQDPADRAQGLPP